MKRFQIRGKGLVFLSLLWLFLGWLYIDQAEKRSLQNEKARGEMLAATLAAWNITPLQNQWEPLVGLGDMQQRNGVVEAVVSDFQGKVLAPLNHFGENYIPAPRKVGDLIFEKEIVGIKKDFLGKAILLFHPASESFFVLQVLFLLPPLAIAGIYLPLFLYKKKELVQVLKAPEVCSHTLGWLTLFHHWTGWRIYLLDEEGNLLNDSPVEKQKHALDLFPEPSQAQSLLGLLQKAENGEELVSFCEGTMQLGSWREKNGAKRFLLSCH